MSHQMFHMVSGKLISIRAVRELYVQRDVSLLTFQRIKYYLPPSINSILGNNFVRQVIHLTISVQN